MVVSAQVLLIARLKLEGKSQASYTERPVREQPRQFPPPGSHLQLRDVFVRTKYTLTMLSRLSLGVSAQ